MNVNDIEKNIWDENILFYRILKYLIQVRLNHSLLIELQLLIERKKEK